MISFSNRRVLIERPAEATADPVTSCASQLPFVRSTLPIMIHPSRFEIYYPGAGRGGGELRLKFSEKIILVFESNPEFLINSLPVAPLHPSVRSSMYRVSKKLNRSVSG